jgi:Glyoxalase-like domain
VSRLPRLRQAVLAAADLDVATSTLRAGLPLGEPFADPGVAYFGLRNAVFALGDTFLEVVSPVQDGTAAGRWLARRGGDCGYMVMFEVDDLPGARERVAAQGVREVFQVDLDDMAEVHLHPADMRGAIVALSAPSPPGAWRWGGPGWPERSAPLQLTGLTIAVADPAAASARWADILGAPADAAGVRFARDDAEPGLVEIAVADQDGARVAPFEVGRVRLG